MDKLKKIAIITIGLVSLLLILILYLILDWPFVPSDEPWLEKYEETGNSVRFISDEIAVEEQISILADLDYMCIPEMLELYNDRLYREWPEHILERYPFWLTFTTLGREEIDENGNVLYFSDNSYSFASLYDIDPELMGMTYVKTIEQINRISGGELDIQNVNAQYYPLGYRIVISYELNGESFKWSTRRSNYINYYNANIINVISEYSKNDKYEKNLYWMHDDQGIHIVYRTYDEIIQLYEVTGINFLGMDRNQLVIP